MPSSSVLRGHRSLIQLHLQGFEDRAKEGNSGLDSSPMENIIGQGEYIIWGEPYLSILGSSTGFFISGWVVPDEHIVKAAETLDKAGFPSCIKGNSKCSHFWDLSTHPYPDHHWHTDLTYPENPTNNWDGMRISRGVLLFKKSRLFWTFADPTLDPSTPR
ncbi:hypothetical protein BDW59DRAFT_131838 [Aspergillus cavernicola]|uniref:Uncharacterized protein n=1 Tax=Aspergillus cavernicola TaxID=176166 RepID=A0ABR4HSH9_9EURO